MPGVLVLFRALALGVLVAGSAFASPARAAAQAFTVLPVELDARASSAERLAAFSAVREARVLGPEATFEPVGEIEQRLGERANLAQCDAVECAAELAQAASLDAVIVIAVWPGHDGRAANVSVSIVEPDGVVREADADVGEQGCAGAATRALVEAARSRGGVAAAPVARDVPERESPLSPSQPLESEPSALNFVAGAALAAVGVVLLTPPLVTLGQNGEVMTTQMGETPGERVAFDGVSIGLLVGGLAALAAGIVFLSVQPFRVDVEVDPARGAFLRVAHAF